MSKYLTVPEPVAILDPLTDEPTGEVFSFARTARIVCACAVNVNADLLPVVDARKKLVAGGVGDVIELSDEQHATLLPHFKNPQGAAPALKLSVESHLRAFVDASSKPPVTAAAAPW
jgi:hypothetical protein